MLGSYRRRRAAVGSSPDLAASGRSGGARPVWPGELLGQGRVLVNVKDTEPWP